MSMKLAFNPLGDPFDFVSSGDTSSGDDNFSYRVVSSGQTVTVLAGQEMLLKSVLINRGFVRNLGLIRSVVDDTSKTDQWNYIPAGAVAVVDQNKTMFFKRVLRANGILRNQGIVEAI